MPTEIVTYEQRGNVALIGINRADKRNAINAAVLEGLSEAAVRAAHDARAAVLFGHGSNFSAGLDLAWLAERLQEGGFYTSPVQGSLWHRAFNLISRSGIPFVSALHGPVIGGGLELACATHIRVAADTAVFGLPEGQRGIFVGGGGTVWVQRVIGYATMADMMLTGRILSCEKAHRARVMQYVVPAGEQIDRALAIAEKIAGNTPLTNWQITNLLPRINDLSHDDGLFMEFLNSNLAKPPETQERLRKFLAGNARLKVEDAT
jgi:enoyl-CoA hydratase/carnithine racemase